MNIKGAGRLSASEISKNNYIGYFIVSENCKMSSLDKSWKLFYYMQSWINYLLTSLYLY